MRLFACLSVPLACLVLSGCAVDQPPLPVTTATEIRTYLMGKTKAEVREVLGEPGIVSSNGKEWTYTRAYCHPDAPKQAKWLYVDFENGRVVNAR